VLAASRRPDRENPWPTLSTIPTWYVSKSARAHVTVALSGDGGDETFAGYDFRYVPHVIEERARRMALGAPGRRLAGWLGDAWPRSPRLAASAAARVSASQHGARIRRRPHYMDLMLPQTRQSATTARTSGNRRSGSEPVYAAVTDAYRRCPSAHALTRAQYADLHVYMPNESAREGRPHEHGAQPRSPVSAARSARRRDGVPHSSAEAAARDDGQVAAAETGGAAFARGIEPAAEARVSRRRWPKCCVASARPASR
jgi:hypothetical protein